MKKVFVALIMLLVYNNVKSQNQGINNLWLMGYQSFGGLPFGNTRIDFFNGPPSINYDSLPMNFSVAHANICDSSGNVLFYTNGIYIADATNDTMMNGSGLNPSAYTTQYEQDGLAVPQADLIIQKPGSSNMYYLFHVTIDNNIQYFSSYLYLTSIDMNLNGGLGGVVAKNAVQILDTLNEGKITACKHANGRDWWVFCHKAYSNIFYSLLVTPYGILGPYQQGIGIVRPPDAGQLVFSPDGNRLAYYYAVEDLEVFDFDRCSGTLSNPRYASINDTALGGGCAFSANSNVLYLSSSNYVYQFDATSSNLAATQITVAVWDSFYSPFPPFGTYFYLSELAPDGKIYITTGNGTQHLHVINNPDGLGATCNLVQHGVQLPTFYFNTLPNHPNYFLGRLIGSPCDTVWQSISSPPPKEVAIKVISNPNDGRFTLWFPVNKDAGWLEIYNTNGEVIRKLPVAQWSQYKQVDITGQPAGVYFGRMLWGDVMGSVKVVKAP